MDGNLIWNKQVGAGEYEFSFAIAASATDGVYIGGDRGEFTSAIAGSNNDAFLARLAPNGDLMWDLPLATSDGEFVFGVAHGEPGKVYFVGATTGDLFGVNQGGYDGFIFKVIETPEPAAWTLLGLGGIVFLCPCFGKRHGTALLARVNGSKSTALSPS